ncbi:peptidoglycan bridge formation glycyltransferase FemA/FemB family protein [Candidatus Microgenomates bacterium]|nr:peptidoglycan bridge formation glycyltransferase FemA/FemB family protein [Candidatus Microgenomates bacterium]
MTPEKIPPLALINELVKKHRVLKVSLEMINDERLMINDFRINNNPYLPTKTIRIDLTISEEEIFKNFSAAKRRAVRKAIKNKLIVKKTKNIEEFIKLKSKDFWPLGYFMKKDVRALWESFQPQNSTILIAYQAQRLLGAILLLFYDNIAYYWMATATKEGKKLFAPTLLVWEALKLAKKKRCKIFDFEGIYDERFHKATRKWQGFTKFKEGFGGKEVIFPSPLRR